MDSTPIFIAAMAEDHINIVLNNYIGAGSVYARAYQIIVEAYIRRGRYFWANAHYKMADTVGIIILI